MRRGLMTLPSRNKCTWCKPLGGSAAVGPNAAVGLLVLSLLAGCADSRISMADLQEREKQFQAVDPVPVRPADLALSELRPYTVGNGDVLQITMMGLTEAYSTTLVKARVHSGGQIELPQVGAVKVAGLDLQHVEEAIIAAHVPEFLKSMAVYVELVSPETTTVMVTGAAAKPGLVTLTRNERNVLYALGSAGGFGGAASTRVRVRPIRPEEEELVYDLSKPNDVRRVLAGKPLESGDIVTVEGAQRDVVYVTGLVNLPGPVPVPADASVSVLHAVYAAGGTRDLLEPQEATLIRSLPDGSRAYVKLNLAGILGGTETDVALRAGDILTVPHTADTRVREWAMNNLRIGPFSVGTSYDPVAQYNVDRALDESNNNGFRSSIRDSLQFGIPNLLIPQVPVPTARGKR